MPENEKTTANEEKKEEKKEVGSLENIVKESWHFLKSSANLALAGIIPATQTLLAPAAARDTAILAGAQIAADATIARKKGEKYTTRDVLNSSAVGSSLGLAAHYAYEAINKVSLEGLLGAGVKAATFGGILYPFYIGAYQILDYTIKNMKLKGLYSYLKENYWSSLKSAWKRVFPFGLANVLFAPLAWQIPIGAVLSYVVALFGAPKKDEVSEERKRDKTPYSAVAMNVAGKFTKNLFYGMYDAVTNIGKNISGKLKTEKKPAEQPSAPAETHYQQAA